jgi:hypothetical protein
MNVTVLMKGRKETARSLGEVTFEYPTLQLLLKSILFFIKDAVHHGLTDVQLTSLAVCFLQTLL